MIIKRLIMVSLCTICVLGTWACGNKDQVREEVFSNGPSSAESEIVDGKEDNSQGDVLESAVNSEAKVNAVVEAITEEEAQALLIQTLGTENPDNGNLYSFGYISQCLIDDVNYYVYQWKWLVNNDHLSSLSDLFVEEDGTAIYEGTYDELGISQVDSSQNLIDNPDVGLATTITENQAEELLLENIGSQDKETGNKYAFGFVEKCRIEGEVYYAYQWNWLVDNNHISFLDYLFVKTDGTAIYSGTYEAESESWLDYSHNYILRKKEE